MKNLFKYAFVLSVVMTLSACLATPAPKTKVTSGGGPSISAARAEHYDGPKARIAVAKFEDKMSGTYAHYYRADYGRGMADMLTTSLFQTNRFIVLERQNIDKAIGEQDLAAMGRIKRGTEAKIGELEGAEIMVIAAVTGFDPGVSGAGGGLGGLFGGTVGAIAGGFKTARIALDLRLMDTNTGRILAATSTEATANTFSAFGGGAGGGLGGVLGGFSKTPMETAMRAAIQEAVDFVVAQTPEKYYHFK